MTSQPTYPTKWNYLKTCLLVLTSLLLAGTISINAHNGAITYAYPLSGIKLDGSIDDWPADVQKYVIEQLEVGAPVENKDDLMADFRIGYDGALKTIYIAVVVNDQSMVVGEANRVNWDTHDGAELYLDVNHHHSQSEITQYAVYGPIRRVYGFKQDWKGVEMASSVQGNTRIYEWAITLEEELLNVGTIALDVVVIDKDQDESFSWVSWGKRSQKLASPNNCGDLMLVAPGTELVAINGQMDFSKLGSDPTPFPVRFTNTNDSNSFVQTRTDSTGAYSLILPAGAYAMEIPQELMRIDDEFYHTAPHKQTTVNITAGNKNKLPVLVPTQLPPPDLSPGQGILHTFDHQQQLKLEEYINTYMEFYGIPGVSLALIKDGKLLYHKVWGYKNATTKEPVDNETLFEAASITKPVFGFVVLRLVEKGVLDLDKPLYQYLPFEELEVTPEYKLMTARHVLIHRSGLPNWGVPLINTPGTEYGYSGEGFEYLKRVVVEITGKPIEQLLDEELIEPLGLDHMEFKDSDQLRKVAAIGHQGRHPTYWSIPQEPGMAHSMHTESKAFSRFRHSPVKAKGTANRDLPGNGSNTHGVRQRILERSELSGRRRTWCACQEVPLW